MPDDGDNVLARANAMLPFVMECVGEAPARDADGGLYGEGESIAPAESARPLDIAFADYIEKSVAALEKLGAELESLRQRVYALERRGGEPVGVRVSPACLQLPDAAAFMKGR